MYVFLNIILEYLEEKIMNAYVHIQVSIQVLLYELSAFKWVFLKKFTKPVVT